MVTGPDNMLEAITAAVLLLLSVLITFASAAVVRYYGRLRRKIPRRGGLLVWHVWVIAMGTVILWATLSLGQLDILGWVETPRWARLLGYSVAGVLTFAALIIIARSSRRVTTGKTRIVVHQERDTFIRDVNQSSDPE